MLVTTLSPPQLSGSVARSRSLTEPIDCPGLPDSSFTAFSALRGRGGEVLAPPTTSMLLTCHSLSAISWAALPASGLPGHRGKVAVCRVAVAENQHYSPQLFELLTMAEQQRARRYHAEADYHRFVIGRATLRLLLGACLGLPPGALHFVPGENHKPILATAPELHYNVSHSGNWVLITIAPVAVGVDVEKINVSFPFDEILEYSFSEHEKAFIAQHPVRPAAFYRLWTRKEAFVKATAQGIDADFTRVPALDGRHQWLATHPNSVANWTVSSFAAAAGYVAAVAYPAAIPAGQVKFYEVGEQLFNE
jgi:4'-phosphopantetheinyl transferase